jgi:serine/threonine protein kinase
MEDLTGKQFGQYQIVAPLGEGGMAAVYKAYQPAMERYVAIKVLPRHMSSSEEFILRFRREAKMLAQVQHVHILPVFDYGEADGYPYIVMPFVPSGTLADLLHQNRLSLSEVRRIMTQIGDALGYAHMRGMIHRDIKPSNILVDERGNSLLTDFGLARMAEASSKLTTSGAVMGTPAYMSPEQGTGSNIDQRSDIYSLGIILYEMVTGRVPFTAETPVAVVFKHIQDPLPSAHKFNPNLPESVELVLLKTLAKSPENRYQTAQDFVRAIQIAIPDIPENQASALQYATSGKTITPEKGRDRNRWIMPAGILAVITILIIGGFWANSQRIAQVSPPQPSLTTLMLTTPTVAATETETPANTPVASTMIPAPDRPSEYLNDVQVLYIDTFDDPLGSGWNIYAGAVENGVMEIISDKDWIGASRDREFGEYEGVVIDFNYSTNSLSEIYVDRGVWDTDQYRRFGVYIGSDSAGLNKYDGKNDQGGTNLSGNLTLKPDTAYSLLIAILPNGELLEVIWDPAGPSESLLHREKLDETWAGLTWTLWIGVNQGTIQFDNFKEISFSSAK